MDLSKFYVLSALCQKSKLKFNQDSKASCSLCFELKVLNESKFSMPWVRCACLWQCINTNPETKFFETAIETLYETKSFQSVTSISISTAGTVKEKDCTLTFYLELFEIPRLFRDHCRDFF